jgi:hypothetical protein
MESDILRIVAATIYLVLTLMSFGLNCLLLVVMIKVGFVKGYFMAGFLPKLEEIRNLKNEL